MEDMEAGIKILVDRGYICVGKVQTGGRPTEKIMVNPLLQKYKLTA